MKVVFKFFFLFMCLWYRGVFAQEIQFPKSFHAGNSFFSHLKPLTSSSKYLTALGLKSSTGITHDPNIFQRISPNDFGKNGIKEIYYEFYTGRTGEKPQAALLVFDFQSKNILNHILKTVIFQSNSIYLQKDSYLIVAWNEDADLEVLVQYYEEKLGATLLNPTVDSTISDHVAVAVENYIDSRSYSDATYTEGELVHLAYLTMQDKEYDKAITIYKEVLSRNEYSQHAYYNLVWILATTGRFEEVIAMSTTALKMVDEENKFEYYRYIANAYTELAEFEKGKENFEKSLALNPIDSLTIYNYGYNRFKANDFQQAIDYFQLALQKGFDKKLNDIYFYLGTSYSQLDQYNRAIQYLDSAIAITPFESYYFNKAYIYTKTKDYQTALKICNEGIKANPNSAFLYFKRYQIYKSLEQLNNANTDLAYAYKIDPNNADILLDMGVLLRSENRTEEALDLYRKAIGKNPDNKAAIYSNMAGVFATNQLTIDSALYYHQKAIELNPKAFQLYYNYANTLRELVRYDEAIYNYKKADELEPNNNSILGNLAIVLVQQDRKEEGKEVLLRALKYCPNDYELNLFAAQYYLTNEKKYDLADLHATIALKNIKPGKSQLLTLSIRANARMLNGHYKNAIADFLQVLNSLSSGQKAENYDIYSNIGYCYLNLHEYANAESYFKQCLTFHQEIDAILGLALVAYYTHDSTMLMNYKKEAHKVYPKLKKGKEGIEALEAEGYFYIPEMRATLIQIFSK